MNSKIIWSTELINEVIQKLKQGIDSDLGCFYERNPDLKSPNILFQLNEEEVNEYMKCSSDIEYFVETYCRFLTDKGRQTVELRPYQREILSSLGEEVWAKEIQEFAPKNRAYILNASRQIGKCLFNSKLIIKDLKNNKVKEITIEDLYYMSKSNKTILNKIKYYLLKIYSKL